MKVTLANFEHLLSLARTKAPDFLELTKPRITLLILLTTLAGFGLGLRGALDAGRLLHIVMGTALTASGANALNMLLERDVDAKMRRTRHRPLPAGRLKPNEALVFGGLLVTAGVLYLTLMINPVTGLLAAMTIGSYLFLYTPLKRKTSLSTLIGAVPGALPIVGGWAAARAALGPEAWLLFAIQFFWQLPHFLALAWMYREDYARAGLPMLPVLDPDGESTGRQIVLNTLVLLCMSLAPTMLGFVGPVYLFGAFALGIAFLGFGIGFAMKRTNSSARQCYLTSVIYLPALLALMLVDKFVFW